MLNRLFGKGNGISDRVQTEALQSPIRMVIKNFTGNKLAMCGLAVFSFLFAVALFGPIFYPLDLSETEETQINVAPGITMLNVPRGLQGNIRQISTGSVFSAGLDHDGNVYVWGNTKISSRTDLKKNMPAKDELGKVVLVSAGFDHVIAVNDKDEIICWGSNRMGQCQVPSGISGKIVQVEAGYQISYALTDEGMVYAWGNENINDIRLTRRNGNYDIAKIRAANTTLMALTKDGKVRHLGTRNSEIAKIPDNLGTVVDIAATADACAAVCEDGLVQIWGRADRSLLKVPVMEGKAKSIFGGRYHLTVLTDTGNVYAWGKNNKRQADVPTSARQAEAIYGGSYQNYAVNASGEAVAWGLKGYLLGTDELGRDVFTRLINGGRMTMTIGAVAVLISLVIGIFVGGISGFFGGRADIVLQRLSEIISSLPFLPMAMIFTAIIGNRLSEDARIFLIMVVLGVLSWPSLARLVRAQVLAEREKEFIIAAKAMGVPTGEIVFRHIIPNVMSVILVSATLDFASCMLIESALSFLGFGVKLPRPTWGNMLESAVSSVVIQNYWWRWLFPALCLSVCVISINIIGDGLRDAMDPKAMER